VTATWPLPAPWSPGKGRDSPAHDLKTYGEPRDTEALAATVEACLAERTTVLHDEPRRIGGLRSP
jgi:hypothetical protein